MKIESLKKDELVRYCNNLGIETYRKTKDELQQEAYIYRKYEIDKAKRDRTDLFLLKDKIRELADDYADNLNYKIKKRKKEMREVNNC